MNERIRKNLLWVVVAGLLLAVAFAVKAPYVAYATYAFLLLVVIANLSSLAWLSGLDCTRSISQHVLAQGEDVDIHVTLTNRRGWPIPWIFIEDIAPRGFPLDGDNSRLAILMPGRSLTLNYRLTCPKRGYHRIGPLLMESGDLFGLQRRFRTGQQQDYISVLPTVAYIDTFNVAARRPQGPVRISNRVYEDPTRISGLREYVPGDPLNRIHWKASARTGELFVKQSEPSNVLGGTLVLDLFSPLYQGEDAEERMELAITTTASIAYLLQMSGEQVGMLTNARDAAEVAKYDVESRDSLSKQEAEYNVVGEDVSTRLSPLTVPTRRSPVQALQIVENLARVLPTDGLDIGQTLLSHYERLPRDAALIVVVPTVSEDLGLVLAQIKLSGFAVTVFLIRNQGAYERSAALLLAHEISCIHIEHERQLHEISPTRIGR